MYVMYMKKDDEIDDIGVVLIILIELKMKNTSS